MKKSVMFFGFFLGFIFLLTPACSKDTDNSVNITGNTDPIGDSNNTVDTTVDGTDPEDSVNSPNTAPIKLSGAMQKGPLLNGSTLQVAMLDTEGIPTGQSYHSVTQNDLGHFDVIAQTEGPCDLIGEGYYYNETADRLSGAPITLRAFYEIKGSDPQQAYLNVFTHITSGLALNLFKESLKSDNPLSVAEAIAQAENIAYEKLGISHPSGALENNGTAMDLTDPNSEDNQYLMALSCIFSKSADLQAQDEQEADAKLQELLNDIRSQLQEKQSISDEYTDLLKEAEHIMDPMVDCVDNLKNYLKRKTGDDYTLPDPNSAMDLDGDGFPNHKDTDIDGDGIPNYEDEAPYDKKIGGGMYFAEGLTWQIKSVEEGEITESSPEEYCEALRLGGYDDWRLPIIDELRSISSCAFTNLEGDCTLTHQNNSFDEYYNSPCHKGCGLLPENECYLILPDTASCEQYISITQAGVTEDRLYFWLYRFFDGSLADYSYNNPVRIRCVRSVIE